MVSLEELAREIDARIFLLSSDLRAETLTGGGWHYEGSYDSGLAIVNDSPEIKGPDIQKREEAKSKLQEIADSSEWYSERFLAKITLSHHSLISYGELVESYTSILTELLKQVANHQFETREMKGPDIQKRESAKTQLQEIADSSERYSERILAKITLFNHNQLQEIADSSEWYSERFLAKINLFNHNLISYGELVESYTSILAELLKQVANHQFETREKVVRDVALLFTFWDVKSFYREGQINNFRKPV